MSNPATHSIAGSTVERSTTGVNYMDGWKLGRRNRKPKDPPDPAVRKPPPCRGEGRGFESRLPLSKVRLLAGLMRVDRPIGFTFSAHHRPSVACHGTRLE